MKKSSTRESSQNELSLENKPIISTTNESSISTSNLTCEYAPLQQSSTEISISNSIDGDTPYSHGSTDSDNRYNPVIDYVRLFV